MKTIGTVILILTFFFTGVCSITFIGFVVSGSGLTFEDILPYVIPGLVIAVACGLALRRIYKGD